MKVLITGGYGFIGSHVAERFYKEGNEVFIIDNLSASRKENVDFKHKSYMLSIEDEKCSEIFRFNKFDIVVHAAALTNTPSDFPHKSIKEVQSNISGLVNMLTLSKKHHVKKFIYLSSASVYGNQEHISLHEQLDCSPDTSYGISKLSGEMYCKEWSDIHELSTLTLRLSNVYGPKQSSKRGVIGRYFHQALRNQELVIYGDGEQTRDFIYVEDVAYAVYRASNSNEEGIYNVSTNVATSINELAAMFQRLMPVSSSIQNKPSKEEDINHIVLDNAKFMKDFDWSPLYSLEEGLQRTFVYYTHQLAKEQIAASSSVAPVRSAETKENWRIILKKSMPTLENILAFVLTAWLTITYFNSTYGTIDVKIFYIVIIGLIYGNKQSILAVVLSSGLLIYQKIQDGREYVSLTYDTDFIFQVAIYLFIGLVIGYSVERRNIIIQQHEKTINDLTIKYHFLEDVYHEIREVKEELQERILNSSDSYGKVYGATKELESLEPEQVLTAAVNVIKNILDVPKVAIYTTDKSQAYLRLLTNYGYQPDEIIRSLKVAEYRQLQNMLQTKELFINKKFDPIYPLMASVIENNGQVVAIIMIDGLQFEQLSLYHQNLFKVTTDLISTELNKAFLYNNAMEEKRYWNNTELLKYEYFDSIVNSKKQALEQHDVPYMIVNAKLNGISAEDASYFIVQKLRLTDYMSLFEENVIRILLANTDEKAAFRVIERLVHEEITYSLYKEE
ncbi:NAD-dependent epimerase/dehydratase family protein [Paenibacillus yanchengensis]|uniref:NAD-dependent epimerase/dehydratase family protein n=1 Tax=Paenibacillus yanchengensis TaxID=2035833 RepID=A0ABW4YQW8_9BACL